MAIVDTSSFHKGMKIEYGGEIWEIVEFKHSKMAQRSAIVTTRLKNIVSGAVQEVKFRSGDTFNLPDVERKTMQYIYKDDVGYHFMDTETYEQYSFNVEQIEDAKDFLKEQEYVTVQFIDGNPVGVELPTTIEVKVTETDPGLKGDTVSGATKPAKIETGATISVPLFVDIGDTIRVDTRNGNYIERMKR